ncbi:hypothetical protein [Pantoea rodasii]|uniref:hypothetical protein n=1 Tax=Pantoea rodasii TaxID=1076549 RepID=UPI001B8069A3|nr:hypothetical protein [Pantoea rodasii]
MALERVFYGFMPAWKSGYLLNRKWKIFQVCGPASTFLALSVNKTGDLQAG